MHRFSETQSIINELCKKLNCSQLAEDLGSVKHARERLAQLQQEEIFKSLNSNTKNSTFSHAMTFPKLSNILLKTKQRLDAIEPSFLSIEGSKSEGSVHTPETRPEDYETEYASSSQCDILAEDNWLGFFRGYEIVDERQERILSANKQCIELCLNDDSKSLENFLRAGIRCFMIDLFVGTELEKQKIIFKLRESELKISREYGFPITATLFGLLSPRLQYTGVMDAAKPTAVEAKGDEITLSTKVKYSSRSSGSKIYVNARFLLQDCEKDDFIFVGPTVQLRVAEVLEEELKCVVMVPGVLTSRLPVLFPARCNRLEISLEELEDITFAREVGITVLVSHKPGTPQYLKGLKEAMDLLQCNNLRLFTRLVLNDYEGESNSSLEWMADSYDGFLVDFGNQQDNNCLRQKKKSNILELSPACLNFMTRIYGMKKPIILNPYLIAERQLLVKSCNIPHVLYYPDKFIFSREKYKNAFTFYRSQNAATENIALMRFSEQLQCDVSDSAEDAIARACVAASFESQSKAIVVCSAWPLMSIQLSHFRPKVPIIHVSSFKSLGDYLSLYHHLVFMYFQTKTLGNHADYVTNAFIFCLIFLKSRNILQDGENVLLVYGTESATQFCDRFVVYKFCQKSFAKNLEKILFA